MKVIKATDIYVCVARLTRSVPPYTHRPIWWRIAIETSAVAGEFLHPSFSIGHAERLRLRSAFTGWTLVRLTIHIGVCCCCCGCAGATGSLSICRDHRVGFADMPLASLYASMYSHTSSSKVPAGMADCRLLVALLKSALELLPLVTTPALKVTVCMQAALLSAQRHACLLSSKLLGAVVCGCAFGDALAAPCQSSRW